MVDRQEVEALLDAVKGSEHYAPIVRPKTLAALCRAWLAVEDAPIGRLDIVQNVFDDSEMVEIMMNPNHVAHLLYQRVRIVKETNDG